jgi:hypothetical protein
MKAVVRQPSGLAARLRLVFEAGMPWASDRMAALRALSVARLRPELRRCGAWGKEEEGCGAAGPNGSATPLFPPEQ